MSNRQRQIIFDSRLPVGEYTSTRDANHPRNITLLAANTEAQAAADQRYDINPPPRIEGFMSMSFFTCIPNLIKVFLICLLFVAVLNIKQRIIKIILSVGIIFTIHSLVNTFENRCPAASVR